MLINLLVLKGSKNGYFTAYQLQCKLATLNFLLETSSLIINNSRYSRWSFDITVKR